MLIGILRDFLETVRVSLLDDWELRGGYLRDLGRLNRRTGILWPEHQEISVG